MVTSLLDSLTSFELIAGTASIVSLGLVLGGYLVQLWRAFRQKRKDAEYEFEKELERLEATGRTVSARTDLGFFTLIELASLRDSITYYRHHRTVALLFAIFILLFGYFVASAPPEPLLSSSAIYFLSLLASLTLIIFFGILHVLVVHAQAYADSYDRRIKEVWHARSTKGQRPTRDKQPAIVTVW